MASKDKIKVQINPVKFELDKDEDSPSKLFDKNLDQI